MNFRLPISSFQTALCIEVISDRLTSKGLNHLHYFTPQFSGADNPKKSNEMRMKKKQNIFLQVRSATPDIAKY